MSDSTSVGVLTNIFTAPSLAFAAIKERPNPWLPLLVLIAFTFVVQFMYMQSVDLPWLIDHQLQQGGATMTDAQRTQLVDATTGAVLPIADGSPGRAVVRLREPPFSRPVVATEGSVVAFLEPEACLAMPQGNGVKVYTQSQGSLYDHQQIAKVLKLDPAEVEIALCASGGAFGAKEELSIQAQTALAAHLLGRPVKTVLTRAESTQHHVKRHAMTIAAFVS